MPVLRVPAWMVSREHDAPTALRLVLPVNLDHQCLVVGEQQHVGELLDQRSHLLRKLQLPAVKRSGFIRQFKLAHRAVRKHDNVPTFVAHVVEQVQEFAEFLGGVDIALAVPKVLDPRLADRRAHVLLAQPLGPIHGVNDQRRERAALAQVGYLLQ